MLFRISAVIVALLAVVGAVALLVLGSATIIRSVVPSDADFVQGTKLGTVVNWAYGLRPPAWVEEANAARAANLETRDWAVSCGIVKVVSQDNTDVGANQYAAPIFIRLRSLANELYNDRIALARIADSNFNVLEDATVLGILIGLATTVFAGLRGDDQTVGGWKRTVSILAIVFPALGTAVAAFAAFYGPREQILSLSQSLSTLQRLHTEFQIGLTRTPCPKTAAQLQALLQQFAGWEDKLNQQRPDTAASRLLAIAKGAGEGGANSGLGTSK